MYEKVCQFLAIVLYIAVVSESGVILPPITDLSSGNEEIPYSMNPLETEACGPNEAYSDCVNPCNDCQTRNIPCNFLVCNRGCDCRPGYTRDYRRMCIPENQCPPGKRSVHPIDYDNYESNNELDFDSEPDMDDNKPGTKPERFPSGEELDEIPQENPKENDVIDKIGDAVPEESEEDEKDKEYEPEEETPDEEKLEEEENEEKPNEEKEEEELDEKKEEEELNEEKPDEEKEEELDEEKLDEEKREEEKENEAKPDEEKEEDKEKPDEEEEEEELDEEKTDEAKREEENEEKLDEKKKEEEPIDDDNEEEKIPKEVEGGSIFNTPFFNLQKINNYFNKINRALGHVFQKTIDEALLMNTTFSNTTEEEVDIDGKKYIITKSVIKGGDNQSSMYIESLSAKPKMNDTEEMKDVEIKNLTQT